MFNDLPEGQTYKKIPLGGLKGSGKYIFIDTEDFELVEKYKWSENIDGYANAHIPDSGRSSVTGKIILIHSLLIKAPKGMVTDHINGNKLDNRRKNLRICTRSQNLCNRGKQLNNTSGFKGVSWDKGKKKWEANIQTKGVFKFLGYFEDKIDAAKEYDKAATKYHRNFAKLNLN